MHYFDSIGRSSKKTKTDQSAMTGLDAWTDLFKLVNRVLSRNFFWGGGGGGGGSFKYV